MSVSVTRQIEGVILDMLVEEIFQTLTAHNNVIFNIKIFGRKEKKCRHIEGVNPSISYR
jgi:hypothetical protein